MAKRQKDKPPAAPQPAYQMPPPNEDVFDHGGTLWQVRQLNSAGDGGQHLTAMENTPLGAEYPWLEHHRFTELVLGEPNVQAVLDKLGRSGYSAPALQRLEAAVTRVFEERYLPEIAEYFFKHAPTIAQYFAARHAHHQLHPDDPGS